MGNKESQRNSMMIQQLPDLYLLDNGEIQDWAHFSLRNENKYLLDFNSRILVSKKS